jgi:hypothetical protein
LKFDFGCKDNKNIWNANKYYEKHPLLGAADRATLYAFVARKQPHEQARDAFLAHLSHFQPSGVQFLPQTLKNALNRFILRQSKNI